MLLLKRALGSLRSLVLVAVCGGFPGGSFGGGPAWFVGLAAAGEGEGVGGDVLGDAAAGGYIGSGADGDGGDEGGVGAYEGAVADGGDVLVDAIVVAGDGSGAYVDARADDGVAEIVEVVG